MVFTHFCIISIPHSAGENLKQEAEMMREIVYHDRGYRLLKWLGLEQTEDGQQFKYVGYEPEQNFRTYYRRLIGNCFMW